MSSCSKALADWRYRWYHDQVLKVIAQTINEGLEMNRHTGYSKLINLVRAEEQTTPATGKAAGILATAKDRKMSVDPGMQPKLPQNITPTTLHPDVVTVYGQTQPSWSS